MPHFETHPNGMSDMARHHRNSVNNLRQQSWHSLDSLEVKSEPHGIPLTGKLARPVTVVLSSKSLFNTSKSAFASNNPLMMSLS